VRKSSPTSTSPLSILPAMKKPSAACCSRADAVAAATAVAVAVAARPEVAVAAEAAQAAEPAAAALASAVASLCRWHARDAAHRGAAAAGARQQRSLTVYRQVAISLAGARKRPGQFAVPLRRSLAQLVGLPIASECVPTQLKTAGRARRTSRAAPGVRRAPAIGHDENRIRVLTR
jgi:hypothetical protein